MKLRRYAAGFLAAVLFVLFSVFPAFAEPHTFGELDAYLVETASDAMLADEAASVVPYSTLGSVKNTINYANVHVYAQFYNTSGSKSYLGNVATIDSDGEFQFSFTNLMASRPELVQGAGVMFRIYPASLPPAGTYQFTVDFGSTFSWSYDSIRLASHKAINNAVAEDNGTAVNYSAVSGDFQFTTVVELANSDYLDVWVNLDKENNPTYFGGTISFNFKQTTEAPDYTTASGPDTSEADGNQQLIDNTSQMADSLQYISESQGLILEGIDNIILHISDQLYAFWDQLYNLIHVPTYSMLQQILQAIQSLNLDITVDLDELTQTLEDLQAEQIANDNQIADDIQNGYDSSGLASSDQKLDAALEDQAEKEDQVMEQISEPLESFTFTNPISQYLDTFLVLGDFLQDLYTASGALKDVINLSFLMGIALMVVGLYRFKGGN